MNKMKDLWDKLHPAYQGAIGAMILLFCIVPVIRVNLLVVYKHDSYAQPIIS